MIRQLIGSSNVSRSYKREDFPDYPEFKMIKCTTKEVLAVALDEIGDGKGEVVVSVIENFLCEAIRDITDPEMKNNALEKSIKDYLEMIKKTATKRPQTKFALARPTLRPLHQWFTEGHEAFCKKISEGIRIMDRVNVGMIDGPIKMSQVFEQDGVHLTATSGKVFVNALLYNADTFFTAELVDLEENMEIALDINVADKGKKILLERKTSKADIGKELADLKDDILRRREQDCLVTARIREELDHLSNVRKEDRIVITGLTSRIPSPIALEEKKNGSKT